MKRDITKLRAIEKATWNDDYVPDWFHSISMKEIEKLASLGYTPEKIAMYYKIKKSEFMFYFMLLESKIKFHYDRGILIHEAREGQAMLEGALTNCTTAQRLDRLRKETHFKNTRDEIMYGGF